MYDLEILGCELADTYCTNFDLYNFSFCVIFFEKNQIKEVSSLNTIVKWAQMLTVAPSFVTRAFLPLFRW